MDPALIGGIASALLGISGGLIGTYFSIKNTNGPRERAFMVRSAIACWVGLGAFLAVMYFLPPARLWIFIPVSVLVPLGISYGNRRQTAIRRQEAENS